MSEVPFDWLAPLGGPRNMQALAEAMAQRGIANDDTLQFNGDFVAQFYDDTEHEPGVQCMHNGQPHVWGFPWWAFLHLLAYYYPEKPSDNVKRAAYQAVQALRFLVPCQDCEAHFRADLLETPIEQFLDCRESFIEWTIQVHSKINERLGKGAFDADKMYQRLLANEVTANEQQPKEQRTEEKKTEEKKEKTHDKTNDKPSEKKRVARSPRSATSTMQSAKKAEGAPKQRAEAADAPKQAAQAHKHRSPARINVTSEQAMRSVRDALRSTHLSSQQRASVLQLERARAAKRIKDPAPCATCGKAKKILPSQF